MGIERRIAKNTLVLALADMINKLLSFVLLIYLARYLGAANFGIYSFAFSFVGLFVILSDAGLNLLLIRDVARDTSKLKKYLGNIIVIRTLLSIVTLILIFITINLLNYSPDIKVIVYIAGVSVILFSFVGTFRAVFQAFEKFEYDALITIMERVVVVPLCLILLLLGYGLIPIIYAILLGSILSIIVGYLILYKKFIKPMVKFDLDFWRYLIKEALPFGLAFVFITIYFRIDIVMLSTMKGDMVVGWYTAAYSLITALTFIPAVYMGAAFPVMSRFFKTSKNSVRIVFEISFRYVLFLALPIVVGTALLSDRFILLFFGVEYINSIIALQVLILTFLFISLNIIMGGTLNAINRTMTGTIITGFGAFLNVVLNLILIPKMSYVGAGIATVATEVAMFFIMFYFISKYLQLTSPHRWIGKPLFYASVSTLFMGASVIYLGQFNLILIVLSAMFVYSIALFFMGGITKEDIEIFKKTFKSD